MTINLPVAEQRGQGGKANQSKAAVEQAGSESQHQGATQQQKDKLRMTLPGPPLGSGCLPCDNCAGILVIYILHCFVVYKLFLSGGINLYFMAK